MHPSTHLSWHTLPTEMKLAIVDNLDYADVKSLARADSKTYHACVPALFHTVILRNYDAVQRFIDTVPTSYRRHIQQLDLCMLAGRVDSFDYEQRPSLFDQAQSVVSLLICCSRLAKFALRMAGPMDTAVLTAFPRIPHLRELAISNCLKDEDAPVSERIVVHIAASLPNLHTLTLDRISRSTMHSSELDYAYPPIPRSMNDDDVPSHPLLGSHLNLPSLLRLPSLRKLVIKDTHLGDPEWGLADPTACQLEHLELGDCCHETDFRNGLAVQRILRAAGASVVDLTLGSALPPTSTSSSSPSSSPSPSPSPSLFSSSSESDLGSRSGLSSSSVSFQHNNPIRNSESPPPPHLGNLKILRTSPFFPIDSLSETLFSFGRSPIESLSISCFEPDVLEVCQALEDFLNLRVCRDVTPCSSAVEKLGQLGAFFGGLKKMEIVVAQTQAWAECAGSLYRQKQEQIQSMAVSRLLRYCRDLGLMAVVRRGGSVEWSLEDDEDCCCWVSLS